MLRREPDSHKGNYGHVFVVAGSARYSGAAVLAATAALRSGAGLVTIGIPVSLNTALIRIKPPEIMTLPLAQTPDGALNNRALPAIKKFSREAGVMILGPGLGKNPATQKLIREFTLWNNNPLVLDADGINAFSGYRAGLKKAGKKPGARIVITPHPGEISRLLGIPANRVQRQRKEVAQTTSAEYNSTVILKGHRTVVASPDGRSFTNTTGNPGMSTAGSGDVLAGMVAAFIGQGLSDFDAAKSAVYLHGLAGDIAAGKKTQIGLIASDIIENIPAAVKRSSEMPA